MYPPKELLLRLRKVRKAMDCGGVSAFYVSSEKDLKYLTGHSTGRALITRDLAGLWVKDFYGELYAKTYDSRGYPFEVRSYGKEAIRDALRGLRSRRIYVSASDVAAGIKKISGGVVSVSDVVGSARQVKTGFELCLMEKSARIARSGMRFAREVVGTGVRELDAVADIQAFLYRSGSEEPAFGGGMLLASGRSSADIHAKASTRCVRSGPVVVDLGAVWRGYHSDMTRTLLVGLEDSNVHKVMECVESVRDDVIGYIRPGMTASSVHLHMQGLLRDRGYELHHLSGHGVGLDVHESPSFSPGKRVFLRENMVFTVEPGVYLPNRFGVRFEDTVVLTRSGCRKLT